MEGDAPVLTERKDVKMWKRLTVLERNAAKGSAKNVDKLRKIIQEILSAEGYANPKIVVKVIDLVDLYLSEELKGIMLEILEKCQLTDCAPQLQAATKLVRLGAYDSAKQILNRMTVISDVPQWEYLHGIVDKNEGDMKSAYAHFRRVYELDDRFMAVYSELDELEPEEGWFYRGTIASIMNGETPNSLTSAPDGRLGELYNAYWEYSNGGGPNAIDQVKRMVREGIEADVELALARFYYMDKDYAKSVEFYKVAAQSKIFHIRLELAEALLKAGNYFEAQNVCIEMEGTGISDRRLVELMIRIVTAMEDRSNLVKYVKVLLYNDYADFNAYKLCVEAYVKLQMHSEASQLLEDMSVLESDDPVINLLLSKNDYASGRYPAAKVTAKKAIRKMPDDIDCLLHVSRVYMSMNSPDKALKYVDKILQQDERNRDALILKKDILLSRKAPDYEGACMQCERIITFYPDDSQTMKDQAILLSKMGREKDAIKAYRKSLDVKEDPILFMDIITSLARSGKFDDVVDLTNDYDDVYGNNVDMWAIKGNAEYQTGKYDDAIESFTRAVEMDRTKPSYWHSKGMSEEMAGEYDLAEISYDKAVLMDLDNSEYWISKASVQEKKGDYAGAIVSLNRVIDAHPDNVYSLMRKAIILVHLNMISEARTFIELASTIEPTNMKIQIAKRDVYYREGDTESTKALCKNLLTSNPNDKRTAIILARTYIKTNNLDEARSILVPYGIDPAGFSDEDYEIHVLLKDIYHTQGKTHEEISTCKTILSYRPDDRDTKAALAEAYIKRGMIEAAKALYDELHLQSPEEADYSLQKAMMADDDDKKLSMLMESLTTDPDNVRVLMEVARLLYNAKRYKDALVYADRALDNDPTLTDAYILKIRILFDLQKYRAVLSVSEKAASNARTKDPIIWKFSGDAQTILGEYSNALISYDTAIKLASTTPEIYRSRGMCQEALGMWDAALTSYNNAIQKDPADTLSMIRMAAIHLKQEKDQLAGRMLDQAISANPMLTEAIIYRATIFASRGNEGGVKKLFDHCVSHGIDEDTKQTVAELMEKARTKEIVTMPDIPLEMPKLPDGYNEDETPKETSMEPKVIPEEEPESEEEQIPEDEQQETSSEEEKVEASESSEESPVGEQEEGGEELHDGFVVDDDSDFGFVVMSDDDKEDVDKEDVDKGDNDDDDDEPPPSPPLESYFPSDDNEGAVQESTQEEVKEEQPVEDEVEFVAGEESTDDAEQPSTQEEQSMDDSDELSFFAVDEEPVEEEPVEEVPPVVEEQPVVAEEQPVEEEAAFVAEEEPVVEAPKEPSIEDYALKLLQCAHDEGEIPNDDKIVEISGIPAEKVDEVFEYLSDIKEYGRIDPNSNDFESMEKMSYDAVVGTGADDIEDDPVISLTSAFYQSGAKDIDLAKRLVAYVYEAMTSEVDAEAVRDKISDVVDDVEFNGFPKSIYDIMSKYRIGVYEARAVKALAFKKDGSVVGHI